MFVLGCGNSTLSEDLYEDGYHNITNIDYSEVVISKMSTKSETTKNMKWIVMDATDLRFHGSKFDIVIEKATLDALLVDEKDPWNISEKSKDILHRIMLQVSTFYTLSFLY